jgi:hypothetical protein
MKVGWLVAGVLGFAGGIAQAQTAPPPAGTQTQSQTQTTVTIDREPEPAGRPSKKMSGHAGSSLASGNAGQAAVLAEQALDKDGFNPWAHYRRAAALSELHRTDEAVAEYKVAEEAFAGVDERGKSLAMYGRAFTLAQAGRCTEARPVYEQYARLVEKRDAKGAAQARNYSAGCEPSAEDAAGKKAPAQ